jgi:hypothetical protein
MKTICAVAVAITICLGCGKDSERKEEPKPTRKAGCQVTGSCKACKETTDCPTGEVCTTFPIGDRQYSGCVLEHGCSAPEILTQAAEKCGTANPIAPPGSAAAPPAGSAAPPAGPAK